MKLQAIECPLCKDLVFSRCTHDFRSCSCKAVAIDGGMDYWRISWNPILIKEPPDSCILEVSQTKEELRSDWNFGEDKYGLIKEGEGE